MLGPTSFKTSSPVEVQRTLKASSPGARNHQNFISLAAHILKHIIDNMDIPRYLFVHDIHSRVSVQLKNSSIIVIYIMNKGQYSAFVPLFQGVIQNSFKWLASNSGL